MHVGILVTLQFYSLFLAQPNMNNTMLRRELQWYNIGNFLHNNIESEGIVSWPNPKQWLKIYNTHIISFGSLMAKYLTENTTYDVEELGHQLVRI